VKKALTADDRRFVAEALLLRRYLGHVLKRGALTGNTSEAQAYRTLELAKELGVKGEYLRVMFDTDVLSITVKNLDAPLDRSNRRGVKHNGSKNGPYRRRN